MLAVWVLQCDAWWDRQTLAWRGVGAIGVREWRERNNTTWCSVVWGCARPPTSKNFTNTSWLCSCEHNVEPVCPCSWLRIVTDFMSCWVNYNYLFALQFVVNLQQNGKRSSTGGMNGRRLGSDKKTWPAQWWRSGRHFEVMTSKWFRFEEAFIYAFMCYFFFK